ncbi:protein of unknown function [endosymbiont DhMRE of Dentiscutata heterogama]|uniref:hypothetical protein n=1 Tax=endosymbiont DhMRE of Dentiscutata heterogama TaxID=1609546 RepID=UPI000629D69C|nr:hypothetical protein [endosymbiont DhMRE of Dentiscutata heterogama]CFW93215.1 protein of unknown function [endosymbiont DhMRE of Dentiscutata heterogama]
MPKLNPYLTESKKLIELVQELKNEYKVPSFEEFAKDYESDEVINGSYENEIRGYGDISVVKSYGPGNSQSAEDTAKYVGKQAISKTAGALLGPAALPIGMKLKQTALTWDVSKEFALELGNIINKINSSGGINTEDLDLMEKVMRNVENKEKSEFAKWIDELGNDLMWSGAGNALGEIASQSSGSASGLFNFVSEVYEAN